MLGYVIAARLMSGLFICIISETQSIFQASDEKTDLKSFDFKIS